MKKQLLLISLFLFAFIAVASAATITTTLEAPADSGHVVGATYVLNASIAGILPSSWYCGFYFSSPSTANSTYTVGTATGLIANVTNTTAKSFITSTFDTIATAYTTEDSNDYTFSAYCGMANGTSVSDEDATTATVLIDNSVPTAPSSLAPAEASIYNYTGVTFSATVNDENTTGCTLYFVGNNPGSTSYIGTHTSGTTTCTKTFNENYFAEGVYMYYIQASDGTNTTNSVKTNFTVDTPGGMGFSPAQIEKLKEENLKRLGRVPLSPVVIGIIILAGYFVLKKKKR